MSSAFVQRAALCAAIAVGMLCAPAAAQTLYKLIDKDGKVTYSETAPKQFDGQVIRIDINPNANTMNAPKPPAEAPRERARSDGAKTKSAASNAEAALERLEAAKKALAEARDNPRDGELSWVGKVGGGARPVMSEDYLQRIARLELEVKNAEEELKRAEKR